MLTKEELDVFRPEQEEQFNATCRLIRYLKSQRSTDPNTLKEDLGDPEVLFQGACFYQTTTRQYENIFSQGEARQIARTYIFRLPWHVDDIRVGDIVEVLDSHDPYGTIHNYTVIDPQSSSQIIDRKIIAELNLGH